MEDLLAARTAALTERLAVWQAWADRSGPSAANPGPPPCRMFELSFEDTDKIGEGGEGAVYKAIWSSSLRRGREVAVKVRTVKRRADGSFPPLERFTREGALGMVISSPHVVHTVGMEVIPDMVSGRTVHLTERRRGPAKVSEFSMRTVPWESDAARRAEWRPRAAAGPKGSKRVYYTRTAVTRIESVRVYQITALWNGAPPTL